MVPYRTTGISPGGCLLGILRWDDLSAPACRCWHYVRRLRSTSRECSSFDAMLCYTVCTRRHGPESHIVVTPGIEAHMANFSLSPWPIYDSHVRQFLRNAFGRRHRPASRHALTFCHSRRLQRPQTLILWVASMDNVHIPAPFFSIARAQRPSCIFFARVRSQWQ